MIWAPDFFRQIDEDNEILTQFWRTLERAHQNEIINTIAGTWADTGAFEIDVVVSDVLDEALFGTANIPASSLLNYPFSGWVAVQFGFADPPSEQTQYYRINVAGECPNPEPVFNVDFFAADPTISGGTDVDSHTYTYNHSVLFNNLILCEQDLVRDDIIGGLSGTAALRIGCSQPIELLTISDEVY